MISFDSWWWPEGFDPSGTGRAPTTRRRISPGGAELVHPVLGTRELNAVFDHLEEAASLLRRRSVADLVAALGGVGERFLDDADLARQAVGAVAATSGFSLPMSEWIVESMARDWTSVSLHRLVSSEFGDRGALDRWVPDPLVDRRVRAQGGRLLVHVGSGSVPGVTTTSMIRGLLVKSSALVKPGAGDVALPVLFVRALAEVDQALAQAVVVAYWPGADPLDPVLLGRPDRIVVYGDEETVLRFRRSVPSTTVLVEHPPRMGIVVIDGTDSAVRESAAPMALSVAAFDQQGCVSPHVALWKGDLVEAKAWAEWVGDELQALEAQLPPGEGELAEASRTHQIRGVLRMRSAAGAPIHVYSQEGAGWTVVVTEDASEIVPLGNRFLWVVPVANERELLASLRPLRPFLQTVGYWGFCSDARSQPPALFDDLFDFGATRIAPLTDVAFPPSEWLHDGKGPLRELVRWAEWRAAPTQAADESGAPGKGA